MNTFNDAEMILQFYSPEILPRDLHAAGKVTTGPGTFPANVQNLSTERLPVPDCSVTAFTDRAAHGHPPQSFIAIDFDSLFPPKRRISPATLLTDSYSRSRRSTILAAFR